MRGQTEAYQPDSVDATRAVVLLVPGDINLRTGGYGYDRAIAAGLQALGWRVEIRSLDDSFPFPCAEARAHAARTLADLPNGTLVLADGLAFGALAHEAEQEAERLRFVALVHHPLALETGLDPEAAASLVDSERRALATARAVVVTSPATVASLGPYGVPPAAVTVVPPGTTPASRARGTRGASPEAPVELLAVASLTPRKGYDVLFAALTGLTDLPWHLTCAGSADLQPDVAAQLVQQVRDAGLAPRVTFAGELGERELAHAYDRADVFVLPTRHEGYGMAVAEAIARGVPVVSTPTGAIPDLIDEVSGILVPIDDVPALSSALRAVLSDHALRGRLADGAHARGLTLPTWDDAARAMAGALTQVSHGIVQR